MTRGKLAFVAVLLASHGAHAFPTGEQFDMDALDSDGGGGVAFTGAPRWFGHTCGVCHTGAPNRVGLRLEANRPELFTDGWKPGEQYHLRVALDRPWAASQYTAAGDNCGFNVDPFTPCDYNGFALEMNDASGQPVGRFVPVVGTACVTGMAPPGVAVRVLADGSAVTHTGAHTGETSWDLCWTAPAAGAGVITAYVAAVDGNGGKGTMTFPNDAVGDDVAAGAVPLPELGAAVVDPQTGGCGAGRDVGSGTLVLVVVALLAARRRLAVLLALASLAGCAHVRPRQRETLAKKNMKFAPDSSEDELDLHMQESREGSTGGYGSSGGGCGCN